MEHLVAAMGGLKAMMHNNQAKIGAEINTNHEEMKAQVSSLASQINANRKKMGTNLMKIIAEMRAW
jgi:hypothetical protein